MVLTQRVIRYFYMLAMAGTLICPGVRPALLFAEQQQAQTVFASPSEAMETLVAAIQADDRQKILSIYGPAGKDVVSSGDEVADKNNRAKFVKAYKEKVDFVEDKGRVSIILGQDNYPMAIPLVRKDTGWIFDTQAGLQELLKRRIGRNELSSIKACQSYVQAQQEYARLSQALDAIVQYAQKFCSEPGKHDGLYWEVPEGQAKSPLGPAFAAATEEGYQAGQTCYFAPYHGYRYKILTAQGTAAPGGAYNYIVNKHMVGGFALVAWPAEYGVSGVMTFIVNQNGIVYEKNLGPRTSEIAKAMKEYNPEPAWRRAE